MYSSLTRSDVFWWAGVQVVSVAVYRQLESMATPTYGASGEIISGGEDLSASGLIGYMFDVIYIGESWGCLVVFLCDSRKLNTFRSLTGLFVTVAVILSNRFWWTYALIPIYAGYKAFTSGMPMLQSLMGGMGAMTGGAEEAPGQQGRLKGKARKVR